MKIRLLLQISLSVYFALSVQAQERHDIHLIDGTVHENSRISDDTPVQLVIMKKDGVFTINKALLTKEDQSKFKFDPNAATVEASKKIIAELERKKVEIEAEKLKPLVFLPKKMVGISLEHKAYAELVASAEKEAINLNRSADEIKTAGSYYSKGGRLLIHIERSTIGAANTEYFTAIIFDSDGIEVQRVVGSDDIANVPIGDGEWWNILSINLLDHKRPITVRVVDTCRSLTPSAQAEREWFLIT